MLSIGAGRLQDSLHHSVICDNCDMMPVETNMEMLNRLMKAVFSWDSSSILTCQNPEARSRVVNNQELQVGQTGLQTWVEGINLPWSQH